MQGLTKFFGALTYRAHRAVIFALAELSCYITDCMSRSVGDWVTAVGPFTASPAPDDEGIRGAYYTTN